MRITRLVVFSLMVLGFATPASAVVTYGDVRSAYEAFVNGGWAILNHNPSAQGGLADGLNTSLGVIRPFSEWDGNHYCETDWHVIQITDIEGGDSTFKKADADFFISRLDFIHVLDGVTLDTMQSATKRLGNMLIVLSVQTSG